MNANPVLVIVIPCYNEEAVLPLTAPLFLSKIRDLAAKNYISEKSRILFVDDGSSDETWNMILSLAESDRCFSGIRLSRNRGHQNALLAGLMEAKDFCDITISIDCDGQDDIDAMDEMVQEYLAGSEIVYGVRTDRSSDSFLKRTTAQTFYRIMRLLGSEAVYNHADYRLMSAEVLRHFADFREVNIYLRGLVPMTGFKSSTVGYTRTPRKAGESHYNLSRMLTLAIDGITSMSIRPVRIISFTGLLVSICGVVSIIWAIIRHLTGNTVDGWASLVCIISLLGGLQLLSLGVIGEYVGKIYLETKQRPRYIISDRTWRPSHRILIENEEPDTDITGEEAPDESGSLDSIP